MDCDGAAVGEGFAGGWLEVLFGPVEFLVSTAHPSPDASE